MTTIIIIDSNTINSNDNDKGPPGAFLLDGLERAVSVVAVIAARSLPPVGGLVPREMQESLQHIVLLFFNVELEIRMLLFQR